ncbi:MAG: Unknown protein [uncultured Sulfurovum sp.]|uniref:Uncharacterized protein n=1 Tax=uncultured Sulfurovum sp. TaxID=269237 RepID=A0A6S6TF93_9BACT|nr:MAG: Unknown protein [uncultured Sulfurovum sp.]
MQIKLTKTLDGTIKKTYKEFILVINSEEFKVIKIDDNIQIFKKVKVYPSGSTFEKLNDSKELKLLNILSEKLSSDNTGDSLPHNVHVIGRRPEIIGGVGTVRGNSINTSGATITTLSDAELKKLLVELLEE